MFRRNCLAKKIPKKYFQNIPNCSKTNDSVPNERQNVLNKDLLPGPKTFKIVWTFQDCFGDISECSCWKCFKKMFASQSVFVENVPKKMFVKTFQSVPWEKIFTQNVNKKLIFQNCLETFQGVWKHLEMNRSTTWSRQIWSWTKLFYQINAAGWRQWRNLLTPFPENETTGQMALKWYVVCLWSRSIRLIRGNTTYESKMVESGTRQTTDYDLSLLSAIGRGLIQLLKKHC